MNGIVDNMNAVLPFFLCSWGLFTVFTLLRPQRFFNSLLLMLALVSSIFFVAALFGDSMPEALAVLAVLVMLAIMLVPVMLIVNGVSMLKKEGRSVSNALSLVLGIVIALGEIGALLSLLLAAANVRLISSAFENVIALLWVSILYFSLWILAFVLYMLMIRLLPHRRNYDYIIIHGCGLLDGRRVSPLLASRIDKAAAMYKKCRRKPILIPSGGRGEDEDISEAEAIREYLVGRGIPEEHIICEEDSRTTMENVRNSVEIIRSREGRKRTALVSSNYHVYRCVLYASKLGFKCTGVGASVAWYYWPSAVLREFAAVFTRMPYVLWIVLGYAVCIAIPAMYIFAN